MSVDSPLSEHAKSLLQAPVATCKRFVAADELLQHGGIMSIATVLSGGLNYAYQVYMGRALGPEQYGIFGALLGVLYLLNVLGRGVRFSAARFAAELDGTDGAVLRFQRGFVVRVTALGAVAFVVLTLGSDVVGEFLGVSTPLLVVVVAANVLFGLALTANQGSLQGLQWFGSLGATEVLFALTKLVAGVALVSFGYGVFGAFGAFVLSSVLLFAATSLYMRAKLSKGSTADSFDYGRAYRYFPPAVLAGLCLMFVTTVDVIVVKHFFTNRQTGLYTAASVLGKILIFLPMGISMALFPKVTYDEAVGDVASLHALFDRAMLYSAAVGGAGALTYWVVPEFVVTTLYGAEYAAAATLLPWYGAAVFCFVLALVVLNFQLARNELRYVYVFAALSGVEVVLMWFYHATMIQIVQIILLVNAVLLLVGLLEVKLSNETQNV